MNLTRREGDVAFDKKNTLFDHVGALPGVGGGLFKLPTSALFGPVVTGLGRYWSGNVGI